MRFYDFLAPSLTDNPSGIKTHGLEGLQWETRRSCSAEGPPEPVTCCTNLCGRCLCYAQLPLNASVLQVLMLQLSEKKT